MHHPPCSPGFSLAGRLSQATPSVTRGYTHAMDFWASLETEDPEIWQVVRDEEARTQAHLELIASENYPSLAVLQAMGSVLTAKYAEGYPGRRYYGGCEIVDIVENLRVDRAKELFGAEHANVQPHAGAQANMAVFHALLEPGDTVLGLSLDQGGHLTHGSPVNFSGQLLRLRPVPRRPRDAPHRHGRGPIARPRAQAEAHHHRRHRLPAALGLRRASARSPTRSARCS